MMNDGNDKSKWANVPSAIRQRYIANEIEVVHPPLARIIRQLGLLVSDCKNKATGEAVLILGNSGSGKTNLIKMIIRRQPPDHSGNTSVVPVVTFSVPAAPNQRSMSSALLRAIGHPKYNQGTAQEMFFRMLTQINAVQTEIIMIDNVHDIPERRRAGGVMQVGNWIRDLIDQSKCLVVLLGTPLASRVTEANAQLRRRVPTRMIVDYFGIDTPHEIAVFKRFLHELDKRLPLTEMCGLNDPLLLLMMHSATGGVADYIFRIVNCAVVLAVEQGREKITREDFEKAFANIFQDAAKGGNPFTESSKPRLLDQPGEPFHNWFDESNPRLGPTTRNSKNHN